MFIVDTNNSIILSQFKSLTQILILNRILRSCEPRTFSWKHTKGSRAQICADLAISEVNFKKTVTKLRQLGLITHLNRGVYSINRNIIITQ